MSESRTRNRFEVCGTSDVCTAALTMFVSQRRFYSYFIRKVQEKRSASVLRRPLSAGLIAEAMARCKPGSSLIDGAIRARHIWRWSVFPTSSEAVMACWLPSSEATSAAGRIRLRFRSPSRTIRVVSAPCAPAAQNRPQKTAEPSGVSSLTTVSLHRGASGFRRSLTAPAPAPQRQKPTRTRWIGGGKSNCLTFVFFHCYCFSSEKFFGFFV